MTRTTKIIIIGLILLAGAVGYTLRGTSPSSTVELRNANAPRVAYIEQRAIAVCRDSHFKVNGALETECGQLADELACNDRELLSDKDGNFWTEPNFELECEVNW